MMVKSMFALSPLITSIRKEKGLSQQALADKVGVSRKTISEIENGDIRKVAFGTVINVFRELRYRVDINEHIPPNAEDIEKLRWKRQLHGIGPNART